jgi:hypothetical protein
MAKFVEQQERTTIKLLTSSEDAIVVCLAWYHRERDRWGGNGAKGGEEGIREGRERMGRKGRRGMGNKGRGGWGEEEGEGRKERAGGIVIGVSHINEYD